MNRRQTNRAIKRAPNQTIRDICNICSNYYRNPAIKLSPTQKQSLVKHKHLIMQLVNKHMSLKKKREAMTHQRGGIFPLLALIPAIAAKVAAVAAAAAPAVAKAAALGAVGAGVSAGVEKAING